MNKTKKIILTAAIIAVIILALTASIYYLGGASAQSNLLPAGEPPQVQLKITGDIAV